MDPAPLQVRVTLFRALRPLGVQIATTEDLPLGWTLMPHVRMSELSVLKASHATGPEALSLPCWTCRAQKQYSTVQYSI